MLRSLIVLVFVAAFGEASDAAIVRGKITTAVGSPVPGARVQLIRLTGGARSVADTISGVDGEYEIRSDLAGRFLLLTASSSPSAVQIGDAFYAGRTDLLTRDIALSPPALTPQLSAATTLRDLPLALLESSVAQVDATALLTEAQVLPEVASTPSAFVVQYGPLGAPAFLFLRGALPSATETLLDGLLAENLGGGFDLSTLSVAGFSAPTFGAAVEVTPAPAPLHTLNAESGLLTLHTALSSTIKPSLVYTGDAGPLSSLRNEVVLSAAPTRADVRAAFSRFDTAASDQPAAPFHLSTLSLNAGYFISAGTSLRLIARRDVSADALSAPIDLYGVQPAGKLAQQNLYVSFKIATRLGRWDHAFTSGLVRKRSEVQIFEMPTTGLPVTFTGANGYSASGIALFPAQPTREDLVTDRDAFSYVVSRDVRPWLTPLLTVRYQDERAADLSPAIRQTIERHHLAVALGLQGSLIRNRVFYEASGFADHSSTFGFTGAPRLGLTYIPVRPGARRFRGTTLHASAAAGVREPSLRESGLRESVVTPRARAFDLSVDQLLLPRKLTLRTTYFHNQYSHEFEQLLLPNQMQPPSQTLAFRTQGLQTELNYQPYPRLSLRGGYTYLASLVEQSAAAPASNPAYPAISIGALTALAGSRPFHRPPNSGFATAEYNGRVISFAVRAAVAGRSDDSTNLVQTPTLLLPNRNLSPGYAALDVNLSYAATHRITAFTQLSNLLDNRHIAPIGYTSTPFLIRTGLRIRLGGE